MTRKERGYFGMALIFSAVALTAVFIVTCIKKKNLLAAVAAVAAANAVGGYLLLRRAKKRNGGYAFDFFDEDDYEVFDDNEVENAERLIHAVLHKKQNTDEGNRAAKPAYEIPVDDEQTIDDFIG